MKTMPNSKTIWVSSTKVGDFLEDFAATPFEYNALGLRQSSLSRLLVGGLLFVTSTIH